MRSTDFTAASKRHVRFCFICLWIIIFPEIGMAEWLDVPPDPGCHDTDAWLWQSNPRTDVTGIHGHAYPEWNATYWSTRFDAPARSVITIRGRFPKARYMSFQVYDSNRNVLGGINDVAINPDGGENNPYRGGTAQGTYTVRVVFGRKPRNPPPNTLYTFGVLSIGLVYRIYYPNDPDDLTGGAFDPVLPMVTNEATGTALVSCAPRPILSPEEATINGRWNDIDYVGAIPPETARPTNPPTWGLQATNSYTPYYPSLDNSYMFAYISRAYLSAPFNYEMVVIRMRAPTFANTQVGDPPYTGADVRFWSMCQDEPLTTSVVHCIPDNRALNVDGFVTFVVSDPSFRPSDSVVSGWGATWIPWGAMAPNDFVYDINLNQLTNADAVFYYGFLIYRQTMAASSFPQSIENIAQLPLTERRAAMGDYWPTIGYCTAAAFQAFGAACIGR